ncbi:MAG: spermidine synthase, partial [Phycisphaerales bacterium]
TKLSAFQAGATRAILPCLLASALLLGKGAARFGAAVSVLLVGATFIASGGQVLHQSRTFFGVHRVVEDSEGRWTMLYHGTTLHGLQIRSEKLPPPPEGLPPPNAETRNTLFYGDRNAFTRIQRIAMTHLLPSTYYHPTGPIGDVMKQLTLDGRLRRAGLIGMGAGSLAAYGRPGMKFDFFEIDPAVVSIALTPEYFSYIHESLADQGELKLGDGRVNLTKEPDGAYDLLVVDAFSSDAIPVHLITREALQLYLKKVSDHGIVAFHVSNRYFDLRPVLARLAATESVVATARNDFKISPADRMEAKRDSIWVVVAKSPADLGALATSTEWTPLTDRPEYPTWTDDYSNIMSVFVGW